MDADPSPPKRVRQSILELSRDAKRFNVFLRALRDVQKLPPDNPNSYWAIAGYHGEPFKPRMAEGDPEKVWGGYCQHANVLFPLWHRAYVLRLEQALQTVCPGEDVAFPYWDQTCDENLETGIPEVITTDMILIDGVMQDNPLKSFVLPKEIGNTESDEYYAKPKGYETVRYPYSGINSPAAYKKKADQHNEELKAKGSDYALNAFNKNMKYYLKDKTDKRSSIKDMYTDCLNAPDYTSFSNTVSADHKLHVSLESPHNWIHLAVGGLYFPSNDPEKDREEGLLKGANGDMGENETASFDPVFFLHHCNVDRVFWLWQKNHRQTKTLEILKGDPGTNPSSEDGQGPTPFQTPGQELNMKTVLHPFQRADGLPHLPTDLVDIEGQLGYTYSKGSLEDMVQGMPKTEHTDFSSEAASSLDDIKKILGRKINEIAKSFFEKSYKRIIIDISASKGFLTTSSIEVDGKQFVAEYFIKVHDVNRNFYPGSFYVRVFYKDLDHPLGDDAVLGRWNAAYCKNCQSHRLVNVVVKVSKTEMPVLCDVQDLILLVSYFDPASGSSKTEKIGGLSLKAAAAKASPSVSFYAAYTTGFGYVQPSGGHAE